MNASRKRLMFALTVALLAATAIVTGFNSYQLAEAKAPASPVAQATDSIIPQGVPAVYGVELGVSYDGVSAANSKLADVTIGKLGQLDRDITLSGADRDRYIEILYNLENGISCEYCCGARSIISSSGEPACGCAHSYAMRGLAKYLITRHGGEFTDAQILSELGKWKVLFFPTQLQQKAAILGQQGIETDYINLASNKYRGIEKGVSGGMVGGC